MAREPKTYQERFNESIAGRGKPPVPTYTEGQLEKMRGEQGLFRTPIIWMKHKDTGHKLKVSASDHEGRLKLAGKGYNTTDGSQGTSGERVEIETPEFKRLKFEKRIRGLHKKELIEMAQGMGIKPEGTVEDLQEAILNFESEKKSEKESDDSEG